MTTKASPATAAVRQQPGRYSAEPNPADLPDTRDLKAVIPPHCFVKSLPRSLVYFVRDMGLVVASLYGMAALVRSDAWRGTAGDDGIDNSTAVARLATAWLGWLPVQLAIIMAHWTVTGFLMWCVFVVGHDCGHTTFSEYQWLNDILGHVTHGSILVP
jgi:omega-3 fatty acid desaturase (delta-15 desaturase)